MTDDTDGTSEDGGAGSKKKKPAAKKKAPAKKPAAKKKPAGDDGEAPPPKAKKAAPKKKSAAKKPAAEKKPARGRKKTYDGEELDENPVADESVRGKALVIVESPAKAKTINKFLGKNYVVKASYGHVRDLPKKDMGIDLEKGFEPTYEVLDAKKKVVNELRRAAKGASTIYLACDKDREGEAIAWHVSEILKAPKDRTHRVTFNEITKTAIEKAFQQPRDIDMNMVNAQQARRVLDRIVGYKLSPLLWKKIGKRDLSAGRVQSVAVKLIVEREREIRAFKPIEYWELEARLAKLDAPPAPPPPPPPAEGEEPQPEAVGEGRFFAKLVQVGEDKLDPEKFRLKDEKEAQALKAQVLASEFRVTQVKKSERRDNPRPPFITSTLQQDAASRLKFPTKKTMSIAQGLYEGVELGPEGSVGLITYMRTDSFNLAGEAVAEARDFIKETYGASYLPDEPKAYKRDSKAAAQEAHEAIRPTSARRTPQSVAQYLNAEQLKVYTLIWERFVACQMPPAVYSQTSVDIQAGPALFRANGRTLIFDGYLRVGAIGGKKEQDPILPELAEQEKLSCEKLTESQHFTQPPARYNEGSLVKILEQLGIGRPSTYSTIISTIQDRGYVKQENRRLYATVLGEIVTDKLSGHFHEIMDTNFTAEMESRLDKIEEEHVDWRKVLENFYGPFEKSLETAAEKMPSLSDERKESDVACPKCGRLMLVTYNKRDFTRFLGCPGYKTDECKETMPLNEQGEPEPPEETDEQCPSCGSSLVIRSGSRGRFLGCSGYPNCKVTRELADDGKSELMPDLTAKCELCGKEMRVRRGRRGPFLGCTGYPECKSTLPIVKDEAGNWKAGEKRAAAQAMPKVDVKCEQCGSPMAIRRSRRGPFLGCTAYPKCRGTAQLPKDIVLPAPPPPEPLNENCDLCGSPLVKRFGRRGPFAACSAYPKCRNTKPIDA